MSTKKVYNYDAGTLRLFFHGAKKNNNNRESFTKSRHIIENVMYAKSQYVRSEPYFLVRVIVSPLGPDKSRSALCPMNL